MRRGEEDGGRKEGDTGKVAALCCLRPCGPLSSPMRSQNVLFYSTDPSIDTHDCSNSADNDSFETLRFPSTTTAAALLP